MFDQYAIVPSPRQVEGIVCKEERNPAEQSSQYGKRFLQFLGPLVHEIHETVDKRPVRTLVQAVEAILAFRDHTHGLLLSELGAYLDGDLDPPSGLARQAD
jgi:hypothetical protein